MPKKYKISQQQYDQQSNYVYDPSDIKKTIEIEAKPIPTLDELTTVEKKGKTIIKKPKKRSNFQKNITTGNYTLIITEKPQAAAKIAAALSDGKDKRISNSGVSYFELEKDNKKIIVACAVGHLFTVTQIVKVGGYPVFDITWKPNFEVRKKDFTKKYYNTIARLSRGANDIIIATDFDVEGEVIGYNIIRYIAKKNDAKRMKFSSLTPSEINNSYEKMSPTIEWGQAIAGETRHFLDWLYGINLSRALMQAIKTTGKFKLMSIGRVQGPTLNLIVKKEKDISNFKPSIYWQVFIKINDGEKTIKLKHNKDITKKVDLEKFNKLKNQDTQATTTKTNQFITPPAPFDLTNLQTESYKFYGINPTRTLQIAQKLYLSGLISYPRTSSQKIPKESKPEEILKKLDRYHKDLIKNTTRKNPIEGNKTDPAHPAIIPTGQYQKLDGQDYKIYNLIVKRFISCHCANAELENKRVEVIKDKLRFASRGIEVKKKGWMNVYPTKMQDNLIKDFNGKVNIDEVNFEEKKTQPPKRFTPASIISELEKRNLGTKATRANIIETLIKRNYIKENPILATSLGIRLIDSLEKYSPIIIDEKLTREIEKDMDNIRSSKKELKLKQNSILKKAHDTLTIISKDFKSKEKLIGKELIAANEDLWKQKNVDNNLNIKCPNCNTGNLTIKYSPRFKSFFIACTTYPDCKHTFSLPSKSEIKKAKLICKSCNYPMLIREKQNKRPWTFCFNPECSTRKEYKKE